MPNTYYKKDFTQFDVRVGLSDALVDGNGKPINLTGLAGNVCFIAQISTAAVGSGIYAIGPVCAQIDGDPELGLVTYQWASTDLNVVGLYYYWFVVKSLQGFPEHFPSDGRKRAFQVWPKP